MNDILLTNPIDLWLIDNTHRLTTTSNINLISGTNQWHNDY
jgi:hypothetical protein